MFYKARGNVITLFNAYTTIVSKTKYEAKHGKRLKIFTPKQMFQRLPIELAQVRAGNTSENLLNETIHVMNSLFRAKEITKKVYNNIMNSISYKTGRTL